MYRGCLEAAVPDHLWPLLSILLLHSSRGKWVGSCFMSETELSWNMLAVMKKEWAVRRWKVLLKSLVLMTEPYCEIDQSTFHLPALLLKHRQCRLFLARVGKRLLNLHWWKFFFLIIFYQVISLKSKIPQLMSPNAIVETCNYGTCLEIKSRLRNYVNKHKLYVAVKYSLCCIEIIYVHCWVKKKR